MEGRNVMVVAHANSLRGQDTEPSLLTSLKLNHTYVK